MRGIGPRQPLPSVAAATPNLVDHFTCGYCLEWVYADDARPCVAKVNSRAPWQCGHHLPKTKIRCDYCWPL